MSRRIVTELAANFTRIHGFYLQFIEECPEALWTKKSGGWPLWQHIVHVYGCIDHFVRQEGQQPVPYPCKVDNIVALEFAADAMVDKATMRAYMLTLKATGDAYIDGLIDAQLGDKNVGYSARRKHGAGDCSHALTLSMLAAHGYYHFSILDAALREHGCKGIY